MWTRSRRRQIGAAPSGLRGAGPPPPHRASCSKRGEPRRRPHVFGRGNKRAAAEPEGAATSPHRGARQVQRGRPFPPGSARRAPRDARAPPAPRGASGSPVLPAGGRLSGVFWGSGWDPSSGRQLPPPSWPGPRRRRGPRRQPGAAFCVRPRSIAARSPPHRHPIATLRARSSHSCGTLPSLPPHRKPVPWKPNDLKQREWSNLCFFYESAGDFMRKRQARERRGRWGRLAGDQGAPGASVAGLPRLEGASRSRGLQARALAPRD